MPNHKMLLIDDDVDLARSLGRVIGLEDDWEFHHAPDCVSGRRALEDLAPDLLVLDYNLGPGNEDGLSFLKGLRADARFKDQAVLILTGERTDPHQVAEGLDLGADNYLVKPVPSDLLLARARALLGGGAG